MAIQNFSIYVYKRERVNSVFSVVRSFSEKAAKELVEQLIADGYYSAYIYRYRRGVYDPMSGGLESVRQTNIYTEPTVYDTDE
jgi:hypothetical protein